MLKKAMRSLEASRSVRVVLSTSIVSLFSRSWHGFRTLITFSLVKAAGMNTVAGYVSKSTDTANARKYLELAQESNLYGVMPFDETLKGHPNLLAYIHATSPICPNRLVTLM